MTTPPSKLLIDLIHGSVHTLRASDGAHLGEIGYADAMKEARRGAIEGVGGRNGRFRFLRQLSSSSTEQNMDQHQHQRQSEDIWDRSKPHSLGTITNIGSYRQTLETGWVWALKLCKTIDGAGGQDPYAGS